MTNDEISMSTRTRLANSLMKEMLRKPFSKITVTEIITDCNVNRNTFYYHFCDIYELLEWTLKRDSLEKIKNMSETASSDVIIRAVLNRIDDNKYIITRIYNCLGRDQINDLFLDDVRAIVGTNIDRLEKSSKLKMSIKEKEFLAMFLADGIAGVVYNYIENPQYWTREDLISLTSHLFIRLKILITL